MKRDGIRVTQKMGWSRHRVARKPGDADEEVFNLTVAFFGSSRSSSHEEAPKIRPFGHFVNGVVIFSMQKEVTLGHLFLMGSVLDGNASWLIIVLSSSNPSFVCAETKMG